MFKKIKAFIQKQKQKKAQKTQLDKMEKYYLLLREGSMFLNYVSKEIEKEQSNLNRHQRRRWQKELTKNGKFSKEIIEYYVKKVDAILISIERQKEQLKKK